MWLLTLTYLFLIQASHKTFTKIFVFRPSKAKFWNVDNIENWKRFNFTQKMVGKLKMFTPSHRKVLILEI